MSVATIQSRRYVDSGDSESDNSDEEYLTDDPQAARIERQQKLPFFGRKKGPPDERLAVIKPSDPGFDRLRNYHYYRLLKTSHVRLAEECKKLRKKVKTFKSRSENTKFSGEDPSLVLGLLTRCV